MAFEKISDRLVEVSRTPRSLGFKIGVALLGMLVFVVVLPAILFFAGKVLDKYLLQDLARYLAAGFSLVCIGCGLLLSGWAVLTQAIVGKGTPVPVAPTQHLIVGGSYKYCRNPMLLGIMVYYLGIGAWFGSITVGLVMFLIMLGIGCFHHKFIEEKELRKRFGAEYEEYKKKTPFLIPTLL